MTPRITLATAGRVLRQLRHDHRTLALVILVPPLLLTIMKYVFYGQEETFDRIGAPLVGIFPFVSMFLVTSIAMLRERTSGTLERLMSMPLAKLDILLGYGLAFTLVALVQATLTSIVAFGFLGLDTAGPVWLIVALAAGNALLGMSLGLFLSAFAQTEFQAVQFMPAFVLPQILLAGLLVPRDKMADFLEWISNALPLTYAYEALALRGRGRSRPGARGRRAGHRRLCRGRARARRDDPASPNGLGAPPAAPGGREAPAERRRGRPLHEPGGARTYACGRPAAQERRLEEPAVDDQRSGVRAELARVEPVAPVQRSPRLAVPGPPPGVTAGQQLRLRAGRGSPVRRDHLGERAPPVGLGPHRQQRQARAMGPGLGRPAQRKLAQVRLALGQGRRALLHDHDVPASPGEGGPRLVVVPVILERVPARRDRPVLEPPPGSARNPSDRGRKVVRRRQAVAEEEHAQRRRRLGLRGPAQDCTERDGRRRNETNLHGPTLELLSRTSHCALLPS